MSPSFKSKASTTKNGTVVRKEDEVVVARDKTVSFLDILSPEDENDLSAFIVTYISANKVTNKLIYPQQRIGNVIGNRLVTMTSHNPRQLRALAILSSGIDAIKSVYKNRWEVKSQHSDKVYEVAKRYGGMWACECPDWDKHRSECKHIYAVQFSQQLRLQVEREVKTETFEVSEIITCPYCKSNDVIKKGKRKCQKGVNQLFKCKSCERRFVKDKEFSRLKGSPTVICVAMDLCYKGNSLAKIKHHLKMFHNTEVSRPTIMRWIHRFSDILNKYAEKQKPKLGDIWNCDEMTINVRKKGEKNNNEWIWNLMDSDTRFLLASTITETRTVDDASKILKQGKDRGKGKPKVLITDGLQSYKDANKKAFYTNRNRTIHFRTPAHRKRFLNQNIERLNATYRERLKVMRGVHSRKTGQILMDGERFYYNFIRPHMGLGGLTPSQISGINYPESKNLWLSYIRYALNNIA